MPHGMVGADVAALRLLAKRFEDSAGALNRLAGTVSNGIRISAWAGPFAVRFRVSWDSDHSVKLRSAGQALSDQARLLHQQAGEQERASSAASGATTRLGSEVRDAELTAASFVAFAQAGYRGHSLDLPGWHQLSDTELRDLGIAPGAFRDTKSGFDAKVFRDADGRYVAAFGGTQDAADWKNDFGGSVGLSAQSRGAVELALQLKNEVGVDNVTFTGHSLGGRLAAVASVATGAQAVTFDAAGVGVNELMYAKIAGGGRAPGLASYAASIFTSDSVDLQLMGVDTSNITNYHAVADPLSFVQTEFLGPDALGKQDLVFTDPKLNPLDYHSLEEIKKNLN
jgi:pimeloyl-ACP methyl ester carboxylesterase